MTTREYLCKTHGYFTVKVSVHAPTVGLCNVCNSEGERVYSSFPTFSVKGGTPRPPDHRVDESEFEGWQREKWTEYTEKLHPDNAGKTTKLDVKSITGHESPTPIPDELNF